MMQVVVWVFELFAAWQGEPSLSCIQVVSTASRRPPLRPQATASSLAGVYIDWNRLGSSSSVYMTNFYKEFKMLSTLCRRPCSVSVRFCLCGVKMPERFKSLGADFVRPAWIAMCQTLVCIDN